MMEFGVKILPWRYDWYHAVYVYVYVYVHVYVYVYVYVYVCVLNLSCTNYNGQIWLILYDNDDDTVISHTLIS